LAFQTPSPFVLKIKNAKRNIGGDCIPLENLSITKKGYQDVHISPW
jgi:hypothetical protein